MTATRSFQDLAEVVIAGYSGRDNTFRNRLQFWISHFGDRNVAELTTEDIEDGIDALVARGKFRVRTTRDANNPKKAVSTLEATGQPLAEISREICEHTAAQQAHADVNRDLGDWPAAMRKLDNIDDSYRR